jgi:hypothetical protein
VVYKSSGRVRGVRLEQGLVSGRPGQAVWVILGRSRHSQNTVVGQYKVPPAVVRRVSEVLQPAFAFRLVE